MLLKDLITHLLGDACKAEEFALWAFGTMYQDISHPIGFMEAWNTIHGDKLMLEPSGNMVDDCMRMLMVWEERCQSCSDA